VDEDASLSVQLSFLDTPWKGQSALPDGAMLNTAQAMASPKSAASHTMSSGATDTTIGAFMPDSCDLPSRCNTWVPNDQLTACSLKTSSQLRDDSARQSMHMTSKDSRQVRVPVEHQPNGPQHLRAQLLQGPGSATALQGKGRDFQQKRQPSMAVPPFGAILQAVRQSIVTGTADVCVRTSALLDERFAQMANSPMCNADTHVWVLPTGQAAGRRMPYRLSRSSDKGRLLLSATAGSADKSAHTAAVRICAGAGKPPVQRK
jgi:hypothetical protein